MHTVITKFFNISDPQYVPETGENYVTSFYRYMISEGILTNPRITPEEFLSKLREIRQIFINDDRIVTQLSEFTDERSLTWIGIFKDDQSYAEYKQVLINEFGTDFDSNFTTDKISLTIS